MAVQDPSTRVWGPDDRTPVNAAETVNLELTLIRMDERLIPMDQPETPTAYDELSANWHPGQRIRHRKSVDHTLRHGLASMLRSVARRPDFDIADLGTLAGLQESLDEAIAAAVTKLHADGHSWADIGRELGTSRQNAYQRFGR